MYPMNPDLEYARSRMAERLRRAEQAQSAAEAREQTLAVQASEHPPVAESITVVEASCAEAVAETNCKTANADLAA
jgi:hypothetical protein